MFIITSIRGYIFNGGLEVFGVFEIFSTGVGGGCVLCVVRLQHPIHLVQFFFAL